MLLLLTRFPNGRFAHSLLASLQAEQSRHLKLYYGNDRTGSFMPEWVWIQNFHSLRLVGNWCWWSLLLSIFLLVGEKRDEFMIFFKIAIKWKQTFSVGIWTRLTDSFFIPLIIMFPALCFCFFYLSTDPLSFSPTIYPKFLFLCSSHLWTLFNFTDNLFLCNVFLDFYHLVT